MACAQLLSHHLRLHLAPQPWGGAMGSAPPMRIVSIVGSHRLRTTTTASSAGHHAHEAGQPRENSNEEVKSDSGSVASFKTIDWQSNAAELRSKVAALGLSAVLAYGLLDGITYTTFFVLAFLGYEKSTGRNPAANLKALLGIVVLMWTGNNITRPFRVAGAAALAPLLDRLLKRIQKAFNLPSQAFAFMVVVATFAAMCLSVAGLLILSRWGK